MKAAHRRPLPSLPSLEAASLLSETEHDSFYLKAFWIQEWLSRMVAQAADEYAELKNRRYRVMQTGQAQRCLLQTFGNVSDSEFHDLLDSLYRFTEYDHPLAGILFRALLPLSIEQECSGDLSEPRAPDISKRPREAIVLFRRSLERWCDWIDAVIHLRTHAHIHLAPRSCNQVRSGGTGFAGPEVSHPSVEQICLPGSRNPGFEIPEGWSDTARWQKFNYAMVTQTTSSWPFQEVDEAAISLWPLVKRHNWTYGDLLHVLRDLLRRPEAQPCREEQAFSAYCAAGLGLHKLGRGETAKDNRPAGYDVALRLCPPLRPPTVAGEPPWFETTSPTAPKTEPVERSEMLNFEV